MKIKNDARKPLGLWAPGSYIRKCQCGDDYRGDKRAMSCADCAYKDHKNDHTWCKWDSDYYNKVWSTECGKAHNFNRLSENLTDMGYRYCPYCGRMILEDWDSDPTAQKILNALEPDEAAQRRE